QQAKTVNSIRKQMPLVFLRSELVRMNFDVLDRALAIWVGDLSEKPGQIERVARADPQWIRYAIDPEIALYTWFDRKIEGERGNLDGLLNHWRQMQALAQKACAEYQCDNDTAVVGEPSYTRVISLRSIIPDSEWQKFLDWQKNEKDPGPYRFSFLLTPTTPGL